MKCVGIIGAMEQEVARLKEVMENVSITTRAGMDFYEGVLEGKKVVVVQSQILSFPAIDGVHSGVLCGRWVQFFGTSVLSPTWACLHKYQTAIDSAAHPKCPISCRRVPDNKHFVSYQQNLSL